MDALRPTPTSHPRGSLDPLQAGLGSLARRYSFHRRGGRDTKAHTSTKFIHGRDAAGDNPVAVAG